jgi:HJR/Mrr/RecB family endonuclease
MSTAGRALTGSPKPRKRAPAQRGKSRTTKRKSRRQSKRSDSGCLVALVILAAIAVLPVVAYVIATVIRVTLLIVGAFLVVIAGALALDLSRSIYAAVRHEPDPGMRITSAVWRFLQRIPRPRRLFGSRRIEAHSLNELLTLSPREFEHATAMIFRNRGFRRLNVVGGAGDYCVDVQGIDPDGRSVVIQCKRYAPGNKVSSREVQTFVGMATVHHGADRGIFVTTSSFTLNCWKIAQASRGRIELIDGHRLSQILAYELPHRDSQIATADNNQRVVEPNSSHGRDD